MRSSHVPKRVSGKYECRMRIRIGNQTAYSVSPMVPFEYAVACGFDAFEWFPDKKESGEGWSETELSRDTREYIRTTALIRNIRQSVHAPWPSDPMQPSSAALFDNAFRFAQDIAASVFNIHVSVSRGIETYADAVIPFSLRLAEAGIELSVENTPDTGPEIFNELFLRLRETDRAAAANLGMCLDIGHANLYPGTRNDYLAYMDRLDTCVRIVHVHMHENYGDSDSHLTLFTGPSKENPAGIRGVLERLETRNFGGCIILEEWPRPEGVLREARDRLRTMMPDVNGSSPVAVPRSVDAAEKIIEADSSLPTWKKKLEWVEKLLAEGTTADTDGLASIAVYLRFIGTGEIPCREDGTHFRPSVNARISRRIFERLAKTASPENILLVRKIYPWLPSFDEAYMRAEPLTLIRDIAHRNDIPRELKQEIKHTLQNKLHRSAGPEDLVTSASLLERITSGDIRYPKEFVKAFERFHEELTDFFNAGTLKSLLEKILAQRNVPERKAIRQFLDSAENAADDLETLKLLTVLRAGFSEMPTAAPVAARQQMQLADLKLEDYSFVLLSRLIIEIGPVHDRSTWEKSLRCLSLSIENLRLGGLSRDECLAVESEFRAWGAGFDPTDRRQLLRVKATLDRSRRLAETYCSLILKWFPEKVERLGNALGVSRHAIRLFSETDIRRHPVFQLSKLVSSLMKAVRASAGLQPWDTIVPGKVAGRVIFSPSLPDLHDDQDKRVIALLERVEGEEEIPLNVGGIIVAQNTPLLSHLAVRARQKRIVFASCEEPDSFSALKSHEGRYCIMDASAERVTLSPVSETNGPEERKKERPGGNIEMPEVSFSLATGKLLALEDATLDTCGAKAFSVRRLEEISRVRGMGFAVPRGVVIPFGVMIDALRASSSPQEYSSFAGGLATSPPGECNDAVNRLREMVSALRVDEEIIAGIIRKFGANALLMARSSANCEDLPGLPAAGILDSIANVRPSTAASAIKRVWLSLWSGRAVREIRNAGVPPDEIFMAVLIQEMIVPEFSFIMHTMNPVSGDPDEIYIEVAVGMGDSLASAATSGSPYRLVYDKRTGEVRILGFASFSDASWPGPKGEIIRKAVDYSVISLSADATSGGLLAARLGKIGAAVEKIYGYPLDMEGLVAHSTVFLVQARRQEGDVRV
jgi:phosphoglucan,water dikinase